MAANVATAPIRGAPPDHRAEAREQLRRLDACLNELENAHERDELLVSPRLALELRPQLPAIRPGIPIAEAMDLVFKQQERYLLCNEVNSCACEPLEPCLIDQGSDDTIGRSAAALEATADDAYHTTEPLDEAGARTLTDAIRKASRQVCILLLEAHQRRAWCPLGYATWEQYVRREFSLSRSRSYELLDQGRVILAIQSAAGLCDAPDISAYAASQIKPYLEQVLQAVRIHAENISAEDAPSVVWEVVQDWRSRVVRRRLRLVRNHGAASSDNRANQRGLHGHAVGPSSSPSTYPSPLPDLYAAVQLMAAMPPAEQMVNWVPEEHAERLRDLDMALVWLAEFATAWRRRRHAGLRHALT